MARYTVVFSASVEADLNDVAHWYSQQKVKDLTQYFWEQLQAAIHHMETMPKSSPFWHQSGIRRMQIPKFPYHLYYDIQESSSTVRILGIIHKRRSISFISAKLSQAKS
ncbi:MAG TPA: hypothetical protein DCE41_33355 [Cytophagales bacterium]|nr:hypothetical protein [Cytophagales bacterium]HAP61556.1 hypothetical protein [Cytophagales bacterium]